MPEAKAEEKAEVKAELKEDADPPSKKRRQRKAGEEKNELKKDEDADGEGNEEDGMNPEAEPSFDRNEVEPDTKKFREDAVHVYGLDFLKTGHMEEIFGQFNHRFIEWINDSSANVVFRDAASARKALESLSYPKTGDEPWRRTPDILVHDDLPAVFLQMRLAAPTDTKDRKKSVPSMKTAGKYTDEANRRNSNFTMASLYDRKDRTEGVQPGKRSAQTQQALPSAEVTKRTKRADRFAATLGEPPAAEAPAETAAPATAAAEGSAEEAKVAAAPAPSAEEAAEEAARRKKRAERFAAASAAPKGDAAATSGDAAEKEAAEKPAGDADTTAEAPKAPAPETTES